MSRKRIAFIMAAVLSAASVFSGEAVTAQENMTEEQSEVSLAESIPDDEGEIILNVSEDITDMDSEAVPSPIAQATEETEQDEALTVENISVIDVDEAEPGLQTMALTDTQIGTLTSEDRKPGDKLIGYNETFESTTTSYEITPDGARDTQFGTLYYRFLLMKGLKLTIMPELGASDYSFQVGHTDKQGVHHQDLGDDDADPSQALAVTHDDAHAEKYNSYDVTMKYTIRGQTYEILVIIVFYDPEPMTEGKRESMQVRDHDTDYNYFKIVPEKTGRYAIAGFDKYGQNWSDEIYSDNYGMRLYNSDWETLLEKDYTDTSGIGGTFYGRCTLTGGMTYYARVYCSPGARVYYDELVNEEEKHKPIVRVKGGEFPEHFCFGQSAEVEFEIVNPLDGSEISFDDSNSFASVGVSDYFDQEYDAYEHRLTVTAKNEAISNLPFTVKVGVKGYSAQKYTMWEFITSVTDHSWDEGTAVGDAASGEVTYVCKRCGATKTGETPASEHSWKLSRVITEGSCTQDGEAEYICESCGETRLETIKSTGHNMGGWKTVRQATALVPSRRENVCTACGYTIGYDGDTLTPTLRMTADSLRMKKGQSTNKFRVISMTYGDYLKSVTSKDSKIVAVSNVNADGTFKLKAKKSGLTFIIVTLASGESDVVEIIVQKAKVKTSKINGTPKKAALKKGRTLKLAPVITPVTSQDKVEYTSSNKEVATVSKEGVIKAKKPGKAKITVCSGSKKKVVTVTVYK